MDVMMTSSMDRALPEDAQLLLTSEAADRILTRMALELIEQNYEADTLWLVGLRGGGQAIADALAAKAPTGASVRIRQAVLSLDKHADRLPAVTLEGAEWEELSGAHVVLCDDVLNSGRTIAFALAAVVARPVARVQVAVLVERSHRTYPVSADVTGLALATTLREHVRIVADEKGIRGYLV